MPGVPPSGQFHARQQRTPGVHAVSVCLDAWREQEEPPPLSLLPPGFYPDLTPPPEFQLRHLPTQISSRYFSIAFPSQRDRASTVLPRGERTVGTACCGLVETLRCRFFPHLSISRFLMLQTTTTNRVASFFLSILFFDLVSVRCPHTCTHMTS